MYVPFSYTYSRDFLISLLTGHFSGYSLASFSQVGADVPFFWAVWLTPAAVIASLCSFLFTIPI
jgi:hypothetical protein